MKRITLALALLMCAISVTLVASDVTEAHRNLQSAQKELQSTITKRDKAVQKQNKLQADYEEALSKIEENQDKQKSLAYKNAVKKRDDLNGKVEQNLQLIATLNRQLDSLQRVVSACESALLQTGEEEGIIERDEVGEAEEEPVVATITDPALLPVEKGDYNDAIDPSNDKRGTASSATEDEVSASSEPTTFWEKVWKVLKIIFWIIVGIIALIILKAIGGKGSSRSSSSRSAAQGDKDAKRRQIASYQADIEKLKAQIEREKGYAKQQGAKITQRNIASLKKQIADIKVKIAHLKGN